jgi:cold shock CspA family protein
MEGVFRGWVSGKPFGFISIDDGSPDVFVHQSKVEAGQQMMSGARVAFDIETTEKGPRAIGVTVIAPPPPPRHDRGCVMFWNERGFGFVAPDGGGNDVYVGRSALPPSESGYLCEGDIVELTINEGQKGDEAVAVSVIGWSKPADHLAAFADMGGPGWLDRLAALAEKKPWEYTRAPVPEPLPILRSYIRHTFRKLEEMDDDNAGIRFSADAQTAAFNTGLVTPNQEEIYAFFRRNQREGRQPWRLSGFKKASDWDLIDNFGSSPPPLANYFDDPSVLLYDRRCELYINIDHVMLHLERFPTHLQKNEYVARQLLISAEATTKKRVYRNYKTAIPQFYRDKGREGSVQLLLPICLENPATADLALVVAKGEAGDAYRGSTVLTLDMAYNNARLLARPDTEWLQP